MSEEYPCYEEGTKRHKRWMLRLRRHEVLESDLGGEISLAEMIAHENVESDIFLLGAEQRLQYGMRAGLTEKQWAIYEEVMLGHDLTLIAKARLISYQAAWKHLYYAIRKVRPVMEKDRYADWFLVWLENVLRRHLF